ncbi:MAG: efflux RND transporter permease subunit, partial [Planctomycetota bacterium]
LPTGELIVRVDNADFIRESIANVRQTAVSGGLLALAVLVVFLRDWRSAAVVAIAMPLAVVATFALIYLNGFSLNVVSFGGLALGVGLLVDNSIVVLESIVRRRDLGADPKTAAVEGTSEVAGAVTASTLTTLAVFVPVLFAEGPTAVLLGQLAAVVSFSLAMSLLTSLTLTPVLAATWLKASRHSGDAGLRGVLERLLGGLDRAYAATLGGAMRSPGLVGGVLLAAACVGMGLAPRVGTELLPKADDGDLRIYGEMAPGIVLDRLDRNVREIESVANDRVPERESVLTFVGGRSDDADDWNEGNVRLKLTPRSERTRSADEIRRDLLGVFDDLPGMTVRVFRSTLTAFGRLTRGGGGSDLELIVRGYDFAEAERLCGELAETLDGVDGLIGVRVDDAPKRPELSGRVDRAEAAALGVGIESIANTIETAVRGRTATVFREGDGDEIDVNVRLREEDRDRRGDLARIRLGTPSGGLVSLGELVSFSAERTPIWFERLDRQRMWAVSADVDGRDLGSVVADTRAALAGLELPDGFTVDIGGNWEDQQDAFGQLTAGLALAIMLLYMVMASQFESLRDPLLIAATLPIAAAGVVATLVATGTTLNVQSFTGLLILAGIVVNNAIVLIDAARRIAREDPELSAAEVARLAAVRRFRPIVMTTLTTVLAMLPIAFGLGEGGELQAPLARVVVGGLIAGTLVSLLAIPLLDAAVSGRGAKPEAAV